MTVNVDNYNEIVARINRKYEDGIHFGNTFLKTGHISTGSLELDIAMGGGVARGRFNRFYGPYGGHKTNVALCVIAEAQKLGLSCAYYNIEKRFEADYAERLGVNTKKLTIVPGTGIEEVGEKMEALLGAVHLHVLDSCSIAVSDDELNADVRDWRPGISARAWGKVFRRINDRWDSQDNTAILIDQVRVNFKTQGEDPVGGKIFDHQSSMSVLFRPGKWLFLDKDGILDPDAKQTKGIDDQATPDGRQVKIRVEKSSVCRPFRTATLHHNMNSLQYDRLYEYVKASTYYGIITHSGSGHYQYIDGDGEVTKLHGKPALREFIESSPGLQEYIHEESLRAAEEDQLMEIE